MRSASCHPKTHQEGTTPHEKQEIGFESSFSDDCALLFQLGDEMRSMRHEAGATWKAFDTERTRFP